ncbi:MAG: flagellar filament capping protein FliD [Thermaurantiacus tibetensis]
MTNILASLNAGSGLDTRGIVNELVEAGRAPRLKQLDARQARLDARVSAAGQFRAALDALVAALDRRLGSGAISGIPRVSDPAILSLTLAPGTIVPRQSIEVRALARPQTLASAPVADPAAPMGGGTLTLRFGTVAGETAATGFTPAGRPDLTVTIDADDSSLDGIRRAINDAAAVAGAPVQAQIVTDAGGARLLLRGGFGAEAGFIVEAAGSPTLEAFAFGPAVTGGLERTQAAADAVLALDGLEIRRPGNSIADLVPGARLSLARAAPGAPVLVEAQRDPAELAQAVRDIAGALNELQALGRELSAADPATGTAAALASDSATRRVLQSLGALTGRTLLEPDGSAPTRLADLGLTRDRTGQFTIDEGRLLRAVEQAPARVEALLTAVNAPAGPGRPGGPLRELASSFRLATQGRPGEPSALAREAQALARERAQLEARTERNREALTRQFALLDRAVGQSKALQAYLDQQIALWTRRDR